MMIGRLAVKLPITDFFETSIIITILGQMLKMFPRYQFQEAVLETGAEYHARGFTSWNHFVAMLFGQLSGQDSLRGIEAGLATEGFNEGVITSTDLLGAQTAWLSAKSDNIDASIDVKLCNLYLAQSQGTLRYDAIGK